MSRALTLVVALIIALATQAQAAKWRYCDGDWEARIEDATVVPDPARAGKEINVIINGEIGEPPLRWLRRLVAGPDFSSQLNLRFLRPPGPRAAKPQADSSRAGISISPSSSTAYQCTRRRTTSVTGSTLALPRASSWWMQSRSCLPSPSLCVISSSSLRPPASSEKPVLTRIYFFPLSSHRPLPFTPTQNLSRTGLVSAEDPGQGHRRKEPRVHDAGLGDQGP